MGRGEPEISCLRYGVRPRVSDDIRGGISATIIDMEVDVTFRSLDHHDVTSEDCSRSVVLHNFHLSCALARDSNSSSTTTASTCIRTICGIVPTLQTGDCVRILASLFVADSRVSTDERRGTPVTVDISIHGLWADGDYSLMMHKDGQNTAVDNATRRGTVLLCLLHVPAEMLFLAPPIPSPSRFGRWIQHKINFNHDDSPTPSAIFEYLQPQTIVIDMSDESCLYKI